MLRNNAHHAVSVEINGFDHSLYFLVGESFSHLAKHTLQFLRGDVTVVVFVKKSC